MNLRAVSRVLIALVIVACVGLALFAATTPRGSASPPPMTGTSLHGLPAPNFLLRDQYGHRVTLKDQRGHAVVLAFFYTHCPNVCPMTAQKLRTVLLGLGNEARKIRVLIVSTDPLHDTPATVRTFLHRHGLIGWRWLLGSYRQLQRVWSAYHVYAGTLGRTASSTPTHSAVMYLIDRNGRERDLIEDTTAAPDIANDLHILLDDHLWSTNIVAPQVGASAPAFILQSLTSGDVKLRALRGKPVLVNFWATWCVPCRSEMPLLERTYRQYRSRLDIIGVDQQEPPGEVRSFVDALHVTYPIALDVNGNVAYKYQVAGTPTTFFVDRHGVIQHISAGPLSPAALRSQIQSLLGM